MKWRDITYDTILRLNTEKYVNYLFAVGFPSGCNQKVLYAEHFEMFDEIRKHTFENCTRLPGYISQSSPLPLSNIEQDQLEHHLEDIIFDNHFEEPLTKLVNGEPTELFDPLAILIGTIEYVKQHASKKRPEYNLEAICKAGKFEIIKELMDYMEICLNGEYIHTKVGSKIYGAIMAIQETPGITILDKPSYDFLLNCFNRHLGTSFVRVKTTGIRIQEAYGDAKTFFKGYGF